MHTEVVVNIYKTLLEITKK